MITKRNLMIAGGLIAAYYVWKKYIKEDETVVTPLEGETSSNAIGDGQIVGCSQNTGKCICKEGNKYPTCPCKGKWKIRCKSNLLGL